jgi:hypothetical protein
MAGSLRNSPLTHEDYDAANDDRYGNTELHSQPRPYGQLKAIARHAKKLMLRSSG